MATIPSCNQDGACSGRCWGHVALVRRVEQLLCDTPIVSPPMSKAWSQEVTKFVSKELGSHTIWVQPLPCFLPWKLETCALFCGSEKEKRWRVHPDSASFYHWESPPEPPTVLFSLIPVFKDSQWGKTTSCSPCQWGGPSIPPKSQRGPWKRSHYPSHPHPQHTHIHCL